MKVGDKVYHWQTMNKIGILIESFTDANNNMLTVGGTTATRVYYKVEYEDGTIDTYHAGEVMKHFD